MLGTKEERLADIDRLYPVWEEHTLWSRFKINADIFLENDYIKMEDVVLTYGQVLQHVNETAKALVALGVRKGTHVAVYLRNCPEYIFLSFALSKLGAVKVPINANLKTPELFYILTQSDSQFLVSHKDPIETGTKFPEGIKKVICLGGVRIKENEKVIHWSDFMSLRSLVTDLMVEDMVREGHDPSTLSDIMYTSGSTSRPKGVMLTDKILLRSAYSTCRTRCMEYGRKIYLPIPLFHMMGYLEGMLASMMIGGCIVMTRERFSVAHTLEMMKKNRVNDIVCVSVIMTEILTKGMPKAEEFTFMHAAYWSSSCPGWVWNAGRKAFGISDVTTGYGMTECGSTTTISAPDDLPEIVENSHGRLKDAGIAAPEGYKGHLLKIKIVDPDTSEEVAPGRSGELLCKGITVTPGYYKDSENTSVVLESDGWFHTNDICTLDSNGYLKFIGRCSDMYKINGENVSPQYIDDIISRNQYVRYVETVGVSHSRCGEVGVAFVELKERPAEGDIEEELRDYCKKNLARFQVPAYFIFSDHDDWPHTDNGKIRKKDLRKIAYDWIGKNQI